MEQSIPQGQARIDACFQALKAKGRSAFVSFVTAGDPDKVTTSKLLNGLPDAGADIIELGMPFSDPSADGPTIEKASERALEAGASMAQTLDLVRDFRKSNQTTPLILMGYFNPILAYGIERFTGDAISAGVDGLLIVDLPAGEDGLLAEPARNVGLAMIRLATPTTTPERLTTILDGAGGFLYYVAVAGVTGQKSANMADLENALNVIKDSTGLPIAVGFGVKSKDNVADMAKLADAVVVGSAIVAEIENGLDMSGQAEPNLVSKVLDFVKKLSSGVN